MEVSSRGPYGGGEMGLVGAEGVWMVGCMFLYLSYPGVFSCFSTQGGKDGSWEQLKRLNLPNLGLNLWI